MAAAATVIPACRTGEQELQTGGVVHTTGYMLVSKYGQESISWEVDVANPKIVALRISLHRGQESFIEYEYDNGIVTRKPEWTVYEADAALSALGGPPLTE